jgi:hypothetical protein
LSMLLPVEWLGRALVHVRLLRVLLLSVLWLGRVLVLRQLLQVLLADARTGRWHLSYGALTAVDLMHVVVYSILARCHHIFTGL